VGEGEAGPPRADESNWRSARIREPEPEVYRGMSGNERDGCRPTCPRATWAALTRSLAEIGIFGSPPGKEAEIA